MDGSWTGTRWIGGWGGSGANVEHLELAHGDPYDQSAALVRVDTRVVTTDRDSGLNTLEPLVKRSLARELVQHLWSATGIYLAEMRSTFQSDDPTAEWEAPVLDVDSNSVEFRSLRCDAHWIALGGVENALLGLQVRNFEATDLKLVSIADPIDYLRDGGGPERPR